MAKLQPAEVKAILDFERSDSLSALNASKLSEERSKAHDYYLGDMTTDMPSLPDRSSAVSTDVADTVEGLMPNLMEIFASGDEVVRFEAVGQEDEEGAAQETDYTNHVFMQQNHGFLVLHNFIKDALLSKNGYVKVWWDKGVRQERETYKGLTDDELALLAADDEVEIEEQETYEDDYKPDPPVDAPVEAPEPPPAMGMMPGGLVPPEPMGQAPGYEGAAMGAAMPPAAPVAPPAPQMLHDVVARRKRSYACAKVVNVPPEEVGISRRAKSISEAGYFFHETETTQADLIDDGFDEDQVKKLPSGEIHDTEESEARDTIDDTDDMEASGTSNEAMRPIRVLEEYIRMDYDGKGSRLYRVTRGGAQGEVLTRDGEPAIEEVDVIPFASMTPIIMPHRHFGRSVADLVLDIQRIKTALLRSILDNAYMANNQRIEIAQSHTVESTIDDLLNNRPGGIVRTKAPGGLQAIENQTLGPFIFPLLEYYDAVKETRTGVTKQGQGLQPNALQNIGENAILDAASAARAKTKFIARIFAETGIRDLFLLLHGVIRKNSSEEATVRLRGKWVKVDPRNWKTRNDMTVTVGLGTGSKESQIAFLMGLLGIQKEALLSGTGLAAPKHLYNTLKKLVEMGDLKSVEAYFEDPENVPPKPPQPDPKTVEAEGKLKLAAAEAQAKQQLAEQQAAAELKLDVARMQEETRQRQMQMEAEFALRIKEMQAEHQLEMVRMRMQAGVQMAGNATKERVGMDANRSKAAISNTRPGGAVG